MQGAHTVFECHACHVRHDVTVSDEAWKRLPDDAEARASRVRELVRHATCPACQARDPAAVAAHRRSLRRGQVSMFAFYAALAAISYAVPLVALFPPALILLVWLIAYRTRRRRRYWFVMFSEQSPFRG